MEQSTVCIALKLVIILGNILVIAAQMERTE